MGINFSPLFGLDAPRSLRFLAGWYLCSQILTASSDLCSFGQAHISGLRPSMCVANAHAESNRSYCHARAVLGSRIPQRGRLPGSRSSSQMSDLLSLAQHTDRARGSQGIGPSPRPVVNSVIFTSIRPEGPVPIDETSESPV